MYLRPLWLLVQIYAVWFWFTLVKVTDDAIEKLIINKYTLITCAERRTSHRTHHKRKPVIMLWPHPFWPQTIILYFDQPPFSTGPVLNNFWTLFKKQIHPHSPEIYCPTGYWEKIFYRFWWQSLQRSLKTILKCQHHWNKWKDFPRWLLWNRQL